MASQPPTSELFDTEPTRRGEKPGQTSVGTAPSREWDSGAYSNKDALWSGGRKRAVPWGLQRMAGGGSGASGGQEESGSAGGSGGGGGRGSDWGRGYAEGGGNEKRDWNGWKERLSALMEEMEQLDSEFARMMHLKNVTRKYREMVEATENRLKSRHATRYSKTLRTALDELFESIDSQHFLLAAYPEPVHSIFLYFDSMMLINAESMEYLRREAEQASV